MFEKQFNFISDLKQRQKIIEDAFLVGSTIFSKKPSDIDVILVCNEFDRDTALKTVARTVHAMNDASSCRLVDDAVRVFFAGSIDLSLAIYPQKPFEKKLEDLHQGNLEAITPMHRPWAVGGWLPEGLMAELLAAKPIFGERYLSSLQSRFRKYPKGMRDAIVHACNDEILFKEGKTLSQEDKWMDSIKQHEVLLAKLRRAFAENTIYLCGYRRVLQQAEKSRNKQLIGAVKKIINPSQPRFG